MYSRYAKARDKKGYTDYKVAEMTGIARSTLSDWKNGKYMPKADKLLAIATVLDIPVETLISKPKGVKNAKNKK
ncbi:MAG: helix-turn-helix transcriptional regulator [Bacteroidales bacterium]|nr:helix-turn-helix transcriptional regulator [Candidatus Scybalousia scybalohippi]